MLSYEHLRLRRCALHGDGSTLPRSLSDLTEFFLTEGRLIREFAQGAFPDCQLLDSTQRVSHGFQEIADNSLGKFPPQFLLPRGSLPHFSGNAFRRYQACPRPSHLLLGSSDLSPGRPIPQESRGGCEVSFRRILVKESRENFPIDGPFYRLFQRQQRLQRVLLQKPMADLGTDEREMLTVAGINLWCTGTTVEKV